MVTWASTLVMLDPLSLLGPSVNEKFNKHALSGTPCRLWLQAPRFVAAIYFAKCLTIRFAK
jgi:hypothetical protein